MTKLLIDRAVLEQALNALEMMGVPSPLVFLPDEIKSWQTVQAALRAALEQPDMGNPVSEPVAEIRHGTLHWHIPNPAKSIPLELLQGVHKLYIHPQTQGKQEPYLWHDPVRDQFWTREDAQYMEMSGTIPLYTHPQPPRQPLTDEQIAREVRWMYQDHRAAEMGFQDDIAVARAIERAHGIGEKE